MLLARLHAGVREIHPGLRLLICALAGGALVRALQERWGMAQAAAFGWIVAVSLFLLLTALAVGIASPDRLRTLARIQDASRWIIQGLIVLAAVASLAAVIALLKKADGETAPMLAARIALAGGVVVLSWMLIHTVFAVHYAHSFYGDGPAPGPDDAGGLLFPGNEQVPDFWDFFYFSLVLGMTCQVSDVQITGKHMRRLASAHGALSFFFNTVILALTINLRERVSVDRGACPSDEGRWGCCRLAAGSCDSAKALGSALKSRKYCELSVGWARAVNSSVGKFAETAPEGD